MAHFFLLSGSEGQRSDWTSLTAILQAHGHRVTAFGWQDLPWRSGLQNVVGEIRRQIAECRDEDVILIGHSSAGLLLPRISFDSKLQNRIKAEVYIAALMPQPGMTFSEQMFESPVEIFDEHWIKSAYPPASAQAAILRELYADRFSEFATVPRYYLACTLDQEIRPDWQQWIADEMMPGTKLVCLSCGHYPHMTDAGKIFSIIEETTL